MRQPMKNSVQRGAQDTGFTLIEVLLVVAAVAIIAGLILIVLNPGK